MNEGRAPTPDFDASRYERPNSKWVCGHSREGCPCRVGPSPSGQCRATTECSPRLVLQPGETKGTWACTRPAAWGGPCKTGPLPDGRCCREVAPCQPERSLRARRGLVTRAALASSVAALLFGLSGGNRDSFVNPRPLSRSHSGVEFARLEKGHAGGQGCTLCHTDSATGLAGLARSAARASRASLRPASLVSEHPKDLSRMDRSCLACHQHKAFHQADVAEATSCSVCHREHQGAGPMAAVASAACTNCHGDWRRMAASRKLSEALPAGLFAKADTPGFVHAAPRPRWGYTDLITSFAVDHPEFRVLRDKSPDLNTLKFNHRLHLSGGEVGTVGGHPLDCAYCHKADAAKAYMAPVTFEASCRACHALNFDPGNPAMTLPHGNVAFVRAYLRSLPLQYADFASRALGMNATQAAGFAREQVRSLLRRDGSGELLERSVFLSNGKEGPTPEEAGLKGGARSQVQGCALCHEVSWTASEGPKVTPPQTPERWLTLASFNHAAHSATACTECHAAAASDRTSDVLLPSQKTCARCHSEKGGARDSCTVCHTYHNEQPAALAKEPLASTP